MGKKLKLVSKLNHQTIFAREKGRKKVIGKKAVENLFYRFSRERERKRKRFRQMIGSFLFLLMKETTTAIKSEKKSHHDGNDKLLNKTA